MGKNLTEGTALSVFPANGSIAWLCQSGTKPSSGSLHVWRTNDGGASWKALPVAQRDKAFDCEITLDQLDPKVVALKYGYIPNKAITIQRDNLISFDGDAEWRDLCHMIGMIGRYRRQPSRREQGWGADLELCG